MRTALDGVLNLLGSNRDVLILALAVLVLVEGGIIVLWARKSVRLRRELQTVAADAVAARKAAEAAVAQVGSGRREREVYSVAGRGAAADVDEAVKPAPAWRAPTPPRAPVIPEAPTPLFRAAGAPEATEIAAWVPAIAPSARDDEGAAVWVPEQAATTPAEEAPAPPADWVNPVAEKAAAWMLPEVEASHLPAGDTPSNGNGNGNGWHPAPTTLGWSGSAVPVEPAADFAVVSDADTPKPAAPVRPWDIATTPAPHTDTPDLTVLDGATHTWTFAAAAAPPEAPPVPTHFDPAMFDTNDDTLLDDLPVTGDVLLVEDDPTIAKLYRVLLESRGYTVRHACDGLEGLDRANEKRPDLVLLDIMMPRMNGIAFLQALRSGEMRDLPVVVLSNFMEKQLVDDAMSLGALEYMVKAQTRPEALVGALPHWLRGERAFTS
jgi:CheY-like chemotaxis protein